MIDEQKAEYLAMCPRVFVRALRDPIGADTEFELSEGQATALLRARENADGWRPIETAPKDGTKVLLFWPQRPPADVGWYALDDLPPKRALEEGFRAHGDRCIPPEQPTHWRPLPAPPDKEEG